MAKPATATGGDKAMIAELVEKYDAGSITAHHLAVECLHMLDPDRPELVLAQLPDEILAAIHDFADSYDANRMQTNYGIIPAQDQVVAAKKWICENNVNFAR